jgi:hypothetical protein
MNEAPRISSDIRGAWRWRSARLVCTSEWDREPPRWANDPERTHRSSLLYTTRRFTFL